MISRCLSTRLPSRAEVLRLFGLLAFVVFGWTIGGFLYQFPSILMFMTFGDILAILSYRLAFALIESTLALALLVLLTVLLPPTILRRGFIYKTAIIVLTAIVAALLFERQYPVAAVFYPGPAPYRTALLLGVLSALLLGVLLLLARRQPRLRRAIEAISDRISVFAYIYLPLGILGWIVVILRLMR